MSKVEFKIPAPAGLNDMFNQSNDTVSELRINEIDSFEGHTFLVKDDADMQELVESVKVNGVITPILVRQKYNNRYEVISGHRRTRAATLAGLTTIPAVIRELTDDEAIIAMVDANMQREKILPSEKAYSYKAKMEAIKRQGKQPENDGRQLGAKLKAAEKLAQKAEDSARQIQRYIRLTYLCEDLLNLVDEEKIKLIPAVELSYLNNETQVNLFEVMFEESKSSISLKQAQLLRSKAENKTLTMEQIRVLLLPQKKSENDGRQLGDKLTEPSETAETDRTTDDNKQKENAPLPKRIMKYFPEDMTVSEIWAEIEKLIKNRKKEK